MINAQSKLRHSLECVKATQLKRKNCLCSMIRERRRGFQYAVYIVCMSVFCKKLPAKISLFVYSDQFKPVGATELNIKFLVKRIYINTNMQVV